MPAFASLGSERVWKVVNFLKYYDHEEDRH